jgi:hypothetical protein
MMTRHTGPNGDRQDDTRTGAAVQILMVDRNILSLWADATRQRQYEQLQRIVAAQRLRHG